MNQHKRVTAVCQYCGKAFQARAADIAKWKGGRFCGRRCAKMSYWQRKREKQAQASRGILDLFCSPIPWSVKFD